MKHTIADFRKEIESIQGDVLSALFMDLEYPEGTYDILNEVCELLKQIELILDNESGDEQ